MPHHFILKLGVFWIYLLGHFVEYCSPAEDCEWSVWTETDTDQFQHRAKDCDGKVEIESRNCNITTCSLSNGFILVSTHYKISTARNPVIWQIESDEKSQIKHETGTVTEDLVKQKKVSEKSLQYVREYLISVLAVILVTVVFAFWCVMQMRLRRKRKRVYILYLPTNTDIQVAARENHGSHAPQHFLETDIFSEIYI